MTDPADETLRELAAAYGVDASYYDWRGQHVRVAASTLRAVLAALGVAEADADALRRHRLDPWTRRLPHYVVARAGASRTVDVHAKHGDSVRVLVAPEDGTAAIELTPADGEGETEVIDGRSVTRTPFAVPDTLPPGYHRLHATAGGEASDCPLIVSPAWLGVPERLGDRRLWGLATQLYSVRSAQSWGTGDLADLTSLARWAATEHDASYVLVNPLHAGEPVTPLDPSPYRPTTRRFASPLYLRVEDIAEYTTLDDETRRRVDALAATLRSETGAAPDTGDADRIDRDTAWTAKRAALELVHAAGLSPERDASFRTFCEREGASLEDFATWCVLTEDHGPDWHHWPAALRRPRRTAVTAATAGHEHRLDFYRWLQWVLDEQLAGTQAAARDAGMALGVVHDLAVGVSPTGSDSWAWQDELAQDFSVGAPPDPYAQTGQDWTQPPWRPDRLAELAYAPFRELVAYALRHSGGLRVDHIVGLFRLWWIPAGAEPTLGTYVRYDHEAFLAILTLEAHRAGAVVIGEDLGTVEPSARNDLYRRGVLGTSILWFEFDWDGDRLPLAPERWREWCLASVTTHDLPPTTAYLAGDHVRLRHELGLLTRSLDEELAADRAEQSAWLDLLRARGWLADDGDVEATVLALHRALRATPARLRCVSLTDAVGDRRAQNQPGTLDEYPNWRVPLSGPDGRPMSLEQVFADARAARLLGSMRD